MIRKLLGLLMLVLPMELLAQTEIERILFEIESNNTTLRAYQNLNKAQKLENKTGIYLENPEVGFNYLWGDPSTQGKRKDFLVSQSFDFPTAYGIKKKIAEAKNIQSDLEYKLYRNTILFQAKSICNQLVYLNVREMEMKFRVEHAKSIAMAYEKKFEQGETNILERNKAFLNLLDLQKELEANLTDRKVLFAKLAGLNGGNPVTFEQSVFPKVELPANFETWFSENEKQNTILQQTSNEIEIMEKQIKLSKVLTLPEFSTGYMSESVVGESFKGVTLGMSIPLWENKNTVKLAVAQQKVAEEVASDMRIQIYNQLKTHYEKAQNLKAILKSYREVLLGINSSELLKKALDAGQITLIEYTLELSLYYETIDKIYLTESELQHSLAQLFYFEL